MKNLQDEKGVLHEDRSILTAPLQRRSFLQYAGAGAAGIALIAAGCKKDKNIMDNGGNKPGVTLDFKDDIGVLNYAYALEQLEAAFYVQVAATPYANISALELAYFKDIQFHEIAHREFFKNALGPAAIAGLEVDFSKINFADRTSVLGTAKAFEDLGVSAYNGAGSLLKSTVYLTLAGKIVSVEARHAAYIRELISPNSFSNVEVVDAVNGLDKSRNPMEVLAIAGGFVKTKINVINL
ncbi:ferritin-like domain-containing protein [Pedobacter gandavensis]|uniref:ferritin-like domain-containing protein n=1 Tax=Pedobacter gandavensis TaxID=2679963 RepID=UPI00292FE9C0|nr:ferritin-like domain-containing protein [Pedobacter gandavensis]